MINRFTEFIHFEEPDVRTFAMHPFVPPFLFPSESTAVVLMLDTFCSRAGAE